MSDGHLYPTKPWLINLFFKPIEVITHHDGMTEDVPTCELANPSLTTSLDRTTPLSPLSHSCSNRTQPIPSTAMDMDSTPNPSPHHLTLIKPSSTSASKLPVKRKTSDSSSSFSFIPHLNSDPNPNFISPKLDLSVPDSSDDSAVAIEAKTPPFKFHRIWTEPDEIRFLQGLLDSASDGLVFPRDLHIFYGRFSNSMPQPYTKSQLSEKLRRLRKKFRVISSRLGGGLDPAMLSPHDRALFELSEKLWRPEFSSISPFINNSSHGSGSNSSNKNKSENELLPVKLNVSPSLLDLDSNPIQYEQNDAVDGIDDLNNDEMNLYYCDLDRRKEKLHEFGTIVAKAVLDGLDESLKEVQRIAFLFQDGSGCSNSNNGNPVDLERRWQQQQAVELDVFARRLRLVLEESLGGQ